jgi:hypothetical protein
MSIEYIGTVMAGNVWDIRCTSTDTKPLVGPDGVTPLGGGSTIRVLDTKTIHEYSAVNINPATTDGWWGV